MGQQIPPMRRLDESDEEYYRRLHRWAQRREWLRGIVLLSATAGFIIVLAWLFGGRH